MKKMSNLKGQKYTFCGYCGLTVNNLELDKGKHIKHTYILSSINEEIFNIQHFGYCSETCRKGKYK